MATRRPENTPEDYFLANRGLKTLMVFFTLIATNFSAFFFLGFAGEGYRVGYVYYGMMAFGTSFAALSFYLIGNKAWHEGKKRGYITPVEMVADMSKSHLLKIVYMIVMVGFIIPFLAIQPIGAGLILERLTQGQIPYIWGAGIMTAFIIIYVWVGGMRSIARMDVKNGILMLIFMFSACIVIASSLGGMEKVNRQLMSEVPGLFKRSGIDDFFTWKNWISYMLLWLACLPMLPQLFMRFLMSTSIETFKRSTILYSLIPPILFILPVAIGVMGHIDFPGLQGKESDRILPMMLVTHAPDWFGALVLTGALAAFMSTMDGILLAVGTIFTRDIYLAYINRNANMRKQVMAGKVSVFALALLSFLIAWQRPASIFTIATMTFSGSAVLFPVTLAIFYLRRMSGLWYVSAIIGGELIVIFSFSGFIPGQYMYGFLPVFHALWVSALVLLVGWLVEGGWGHPMTSHRMTPPKK
jgi:SSS family solute:Na+ symporter